MSWSEGSCVLEIKVRRSHWTGNLASNDSSLCRIINTRTVSLLKQIMSLAEWNVEKSKDITQQYYHWLKLISKYDVFSCERISDTVKITLELQQCSSSKDKGYLSVQQHQQERGDQLCQGRQRQRSKIKRPSKRKRVKRILRQFPASEGKSKGKGKTKSNGKGQWTTWSWNHAQIGIRISDQKGHKGKSGKGKVYCQVCGK